MAKRAFVGRCLWVAAVCAAVAAAAVPARAAGERFALVIGIKGYEKYPSARKLRFADVDASRFTDFIKTEAGGSFPAENIRLLLNENATRERIYQELDSLGGKVKSSDLVYVYFAGHGENDPFGRAYFMPYDADDELPPARGIRADQFLGDVKLYLNPKHMVFFIDACHAGAALMPDGQARGEPENIASDITAMWQTIFNRNDTVSMAFLSAGTTQSSWEDEGLGQGLFTYFLLKGLGGAADDNGDQTVSADELYDYVRVQVRQASMAKPSIQTPIVSPSFQPDFLLAVTPRREQGDAAGEKMRLVKQFFKSSDRDEAGAYKAAKAYLAKYSANSSQEIVAHFTSWVADYERRLTPAEGKFDLYDRFRDKFRGDAAQQKEAYEAATRFLAAYGRDEDEYVAYVRKWAGKYEKAKLDFDFNRARAAKNYPEAYRLGKQRVEQSPQGLAELLDLSSVIVSATGQPDLQSIPEPEAIGYLRGALKLIEQSPAAEATTGSSQNRWLPFQGRDAAVGWLNVSLGVRTSAENPREASALIATGILTSTEVRATPSPYFALSNAYNRGLYEPLAKEYKSICEGKALTNDCQRRLDEVYKAMDAIIDSLARAVALSGDTPGFAKARGMSRLTELHKLRQEHGPTASLDSIIAGALKRPFVPYQPK